MFNEAKNWFKLLRDDLVKNTQVFEKKSFIEKRWKHHDEGGGLMTKIKGNVIEKGGINISTVSGKFNEKMQKNVLGASQDPTFSATGRVLFSSARDDLIFRLSASIGRGRSLSRRAGFHA